MDVIAEIFLKVLSMSITASVVIVFVLLIRGSIMRDFPKRYVYLLWLIVGVRLVCPITIPSSVSVFNLGYYIQKAPFVQDMLRDMSVADSGARSSDGAQRSGNMAAMPNGTDNQTGNVAEMPNGTGNQTGNAAEMPNGTGNQTGNAAAMPNGTGNQTGNAAEMPNGTGKSASGDIGGLSGGSSVSDADNKNKPSGIGGQFLANREKMSADAGSNMYSDGSSAASENAKQSLSNSGSAKATDVSGMQAAKSGQPENAQEMSAWDIVNRLMPYKVSIVLGLIWVSGIAMILLWNLIQYYGMKKRLCKAVLFHDNIFECDGISSPFVMGLIRPRIYIPFRLDGQEREYILRHEKYHISRHDYIVNYISFFITLAYWFNPLVWVSYFCMVRDMEMSCDEYVLAGMDMDIRKNYSESLLAFATNRRRFRMNLPAFGESDTRRRVKNIMNFSKKGKWIGITAVAILFAIGVVCMTDARAIRTDKKIKAEKETDEKKVNIEDGKDNNGKSNNGNDGKDNDGKNDNDKYNMETKTNGNETIIAEEQINGWQVQIVLKRGEKKKIIMNSPKSSYTNVYEGTFYMRSCKDNKVHDKYALTFFDGEKTLIFPEKIALKFADYDGDRNADDFSLGQRNVSFGMEYQFYTVDEDGSIARYELLTDTTTTESITTRNEVYMDEENNGYSKLFDADGESIKYKALDKKGDKEYDAEVCAARIVRLNGDDEDNDENGTQRALHKAVNATMPQDIVIEAGTGMWHELKYGENETGYLLANSDICSDITMRLDFTFYKETLIRYVSKDYGFVETMQEKRINTKQAVELVRKFAKEFIGEKFETADIKNAKLPTGYNSKDFAAFTDRKGNSYLVRLNRSMVTEFEVGNLATGFVTDKQEDTGFIQEKQREIKAREKAEDEERNRKEKERESTVMLLYYEPVSKMETPEYYIPDVTEQKKLQKLAAKLDPSYVCNAKEKKQFYKEKDMGYCIEYAGNVWGVYSGGYVWLMYGKDYDSGSEGLNVMHYKELCSLTEKLLKESVDYASTDPKEIKGITSATLVYSTGELYHTSQEVTDKKSLRTLEKLLSTAENMRGSSKCPMGDAVLTLRRDGKKNIYISLATDGCAVFRLNGAYYDYGSTKNGTKLRRLFKKVKWEHIDD